MSTDEDKAAEAEAQLEECCRDIAAELEKVHAQLSASKTTTVPRHPRSQAETAVLQQKERSLRAHIEQLNEAITDTDDIVSSDNPVLGELLCEELTDDVNQLQQTLSMLRTQRTVLSQQIDSENQLKRDFEHLRSLLEEQLSDIENDPRADTSSSEALEKAKAQRSRLKRLCKTRHEQLVTFVQKHFPPLTNEDIRNWRKMNSTSSRAADASSFQSLETLLETLMNKCLETPNDTYIDIDDTLWPPYTEMLLRSGLVQRHPTDLRRIRLTPFQY